MLIFTAVKPISFGSLLRPCRFTMCRLLEMSTRYSSNISRQKADDVAKIRNIGIMAHIDAGKTTTTERILYYSGFSRHLGDVDRGDTVTDFMEEERERGITIQSAAITFLWKKHKINLIDTPGHVDFTVEVERCLRVLDGAVTVLDASAGVEAQTQTVWKQADRYKVPRIIFLNKMDKQGANFNMCLNSIKQQLHMEPLVVHLPIGNERSFCGMFDLVTMEQKIWDTKKCEDGRVYEVEKVSTEEIDSTVDIVKKARESLIGQLAEFDETIADHVLSDHKFEDIPVTDIYEALKNVTLSGKAVVILCGSARRNIGIQPLMDAIVHYLPSPLDIQHDFIKYYEPDLCALAFKIVHNTHLGALTYVRIYSGSLQSGTSLYNINLQEIEKVGKQAVFQVYADEYKAIQWSGPGNIVCIAGLEKTKTGDTVTATTASVKEMLQRYENQEDGEVLSLAGVEVQPPVFFCSIEAPSVSKQRDMEKALELLQREDPSLKVEMDKDTGQMILAGMGELHLEIVKHRLEKEFKVEAYLGPLQIAYREILGEEVSHSKIMESTIGSTHNSVAMSVNVRHNDKVPFFKYITINPDVESPSYKIRTALNIGVKSALNYGPLLHFPLMNVEVELTNLIVEKRTSVHFIQAVASQCVQEALTQAQCYLTEPVMAVEVGTNATYLSSVQADLARRRGDVRSLFEKNGMITVHAQVPLAELVGYSTDLRTFTSGTASFTMELDHYERLTPHEQNKVLSKMVF